MMMEYKPTPVNSKERELGISYFLTSSKGIGGRLRTYPEDFQVLEISNLPEESDGDLTAAVITSRNWETNRLIRTLARRLRISRKRVMFAGTKDKRAITTQLFVFHADIEDVKALNIPDVQFGKIYSTHKKLNMGDLIGNKFEIVVREMEKDVEEACSLSEKIRDELLSIGGFANYFGVQRFGAIRPITHTIGRHIIEGEFKKAVDSYLSDCPGKENDEIMEARSELKTTGDYAKALTRFPNILSFEKAMLNHLVVNPEDYVGALNNLPKNLLMMFVHAYQSFIFNKIISKRLEDGLSLSVPVEGDAVLKLDKYGLPDHNEWVVAESYNIPKLTKQIQRGKAFISAPLIGWETVFTSGSPGDIEKNVFEAEEIKQKDFIIPDFDKLSSKGSRREVLAPLKEMDISIVDDGLKMSFDLNKGCYATSLLREFLKSDNLLKY